jgi:hypothetical protein
MNIDMSNEENYQTALELAGAASDCEGWGLCKTEWLHEIAGNSPELWTAWTKDEKGEPLVVAITGNGPMSKAGAEFFASARKIVFGMAAEIERLRASVDALRSDR